MTLRLRRRTPLHTRCVSALVLTNPMAPCPAPAPEAMSAHTRAPATPA